MPRTHLSLMPLEPRENPSVPSLDPFGTHTPVPYQPPATPQPPPPPAPPAPGFFEAAALAIERELVRQHAERMMLEGNPYLHDNSVYKIPLGVPPLPR